MSNERYAKQDEQLYYHIQRLQQGYVDSYTEIYNLSGKYLYKIIYDIVQEHHTAEDMLQETFIRIYKNIGSLQNPQAFYVWAGRIASNLCIRYLHKYRNEVLQTVMDDGEGNEEFIFETIADDHEMFIPESVLDNKEHQRMIGDVIDGLSVDQKLVVQCFYFEEMSVREIAQALGCSEGTVKSRLNYARKSIKEAVLRIEKTQGTKLYSLGALPILLLAYRSMAEATVSTATTVTVGASITEALSAGTTKAVGTVGTTGTIGAAGATGVVGTGTVGTTAVAGAAGAGISAKVVAIVVSIVIAIGGLVGGTIYGLTVWDGDDKQEEYTGEQSKQEQSEWETSEDVAEDIPEDIPVNRHEGIIPPGGKYIVGYTGEILTEGDTMPDMAEYSDCYYYGDFVYNAYDEGWEVKLNAEDYAIKTSFGELVGIIAGKPVIDAASLFYGCESMTEAPALPATVTNMRWAFYDCKSLVEAPVLPKKVQDLENAFTGCSSLTKAPKIPDGVTNMLGTFYGCSAMTQAPKIPAGVTNMGDTFGECTSLLEAPEIPAGVTCLAGTFSGCVSLKAAPQIPYGMVDMSYTFTGCENLIKAPEIPETVLYMPGTFWECENLVEAPEIPSGVTDLSYTFDHCQSLVEAPKIPYGVTDMTNTFYYCYNLANAPEIPDTVINMRFTFAECKSITKAPEIPANVINMYHTFSSCSNLTGTVIIHANPTEYEGCFGTLDLVQQKVELGGSSAMLEELRATAFVY